jgi:hypothetical protein
VLTDFARLEVGPLEGDILGFVAGLEVDVLELDKGHLDGDKEGDMLFCLMDYP